MSALTPDQLKAMAEELRDLVTEMTETVGGARWHALAMDMLANSPPLLNQLCHRINKAVNPPD